MVDHSVIVLVESESEYLIDLEVENVVEGVVVEEEEKWIVKISLSYHWVYVHEEKLIDLSEELHCSDSDHAKWLLANSIGSLMHISLWVLVRDSQVLRYIL